MSKIDALRAMREARYEEAAARARTSPAVPTRSPRAVVPERATEPEPSAAGPAEDPLCGHRSMNGRTCTREQGHAAKSHRYS
jgi:hypothetical protein